MQRRVSRAPLGSARRDGVLHEIDSIFSSSRTRLDGHEVRARADLGGKTTQTSPRLPSHAVRGSVEASWSEKVPSGTGHRVLCTFDIAMLPKQKNTAYPAAAAPRARRRVAAEKKRVQQRFPVHGRPAQARRPLPSVPKASLFSLFSSPALFLSE